jgi:hypothetical protein
VKTAAHISVSKQSFQRKRRPEGPPFFADLL